MTRAEYIARIIAAAIALATEPLTDRLERRPPCSEAK